jgi:hypothetical protein
MAFFFIPILYEKWALILTVAAAQTSQSALLQGSAFPGQSANHPL